MGRPGKLGVRNGIKGNGQMSLNNFNADAKAQELARKIEASVGDAKLMNVNDQFQKNAQYRKDKDPKGYLDVIAHGSEYTIIITYNGKQSVLKAKQAAKMINNLSEYKGQPIRLLSCNTGSQSNGFAQNLANKLGVPVMAPNNLLWNYSNKAGNMDVAPRKKTDPSNPDLNQKGEFVIFYPKKKKVK